MEVANIIENGIASSSAKSPESITGDQYHYFPLVNKDSLNAVPQQNAHYSGDERQDCFIKRKLTAFSHFG